MESGTDRARILRRLRPDDVERRAGLGAIPDDVLAQASTILEKVRREGDAALLQFCERFDELAGGRLFLPKSDLEAALDSLDAEERERLERIARRIETFASAQRAAIRETSVAIPGGSAGHTIAPVERAGCYAPGGRYPLPSSVLMTAITARVAGVEEIWVASPRPDRITLAAAALAGATGVLAAGGAHAIAALAFGTQQTSPCDIVVGPGSVWVTAAKKLLAGEVAIDMLAGPSEVVILADDSAPPDLIAADLLAQAEHAPDALPLLVSCSETLIGQVETELGKQLAALPTRTVATASLQKGAAVLCGELAEACAICDRLAPEHLQVLIEDAEQVSGKLRHYGSLFLGPASPTALGDYGAGPNHVLPTGGTSRATGGLSVLNFLRFRTWLRLDDTAAAAEVFDDSAWLARVEGLAAHARSLAKRSRFS